MHEHIYGEYVSTALRSCVRMALVRQKLKLTNKGFFFNIYRLHKICLHVVVSYNTLAVSYLQCSKKSTHISKLLRESKKSSKLKCKYTEPETEALTHRNRYCESMTYSDCANDTHLIAVPEDPNKWPLEKFSQDTIHTKTACHN